MWVVNIFLFALFLALGVVPLMTWAEEKKHFKSISFVRTILVVQAWILLTTLEALRYAFMKYVLGQDVRMRAHKSCGSIARGILHVFFDGFEILGTENLTKLNEDVPFVIIANHQSMLDVAAIFAINLKAAWVAKTTVFMMPGVGWLMYMAGYVPVERKNNASIKKMYAQCKEVVKQNWSLILFPQGTRSRKEFLPFKNGAYNLAAELSMPLLPVSIYIPGDVWANGTKIRIMIHPPVNDCTEATKDDIREKTYETIKAGLEKLTASSSSTKKEN